MTSFFTRYARQGEHEQVWNELRRLGPVPGAFEEDVVAVATATMERFARHVVRLAEALPELGFVRASEGLPPHQPPTEATPAAVREMEEAVGPLPAALKASFLTVGDVSFLGDCPALGLHYHGGFEPEPGPPGVEYPDPLDVAGVEHLRYEWEAYTEDPDGDDGDDEEFLFSIAPDEFHKANVSGGTHDVVLPDACADPEVYGVRGRKGITLVEYLRTSIAWGGLPGWEFAPGRPPAALERLAVRPDF
ncbi:hypothetical protein [Streptomyces huiliensis]|uniref:hypothetical protein n=1 Tax=Streptomyces huiliensis TaxID=2876027 RepID=UPI001CC0E500|nr:hypothetical protein [Streptomyces huiliensis]MBZ4320868.1 hypothetical protein [Streptomyces huiliensis]